MWLPCWLNTLFLPGSPINWLADQPNRLLPTWLTIWLKGWITDCNADWMDSMLGWWLSGWMDLDGYLPRLTVVRWMISKLNGGVAGRVNGWLDGWTSFRIGYCGYLLPVSWLDSLIGLECLVRWFINWIRGFVTRLMDSRGLGGFTTWQLSR